MLNDPLQSNNVEGSICWEEYVRIKHEDWECSACSQAGHQALEMYERDLTTSPLQVECLSTKTLPTRAAKPKLPADFENMTWAKLNEAVLAVHSKTGVSLSLEELYRVR